MAWLVDRGLELVKNLTTSSDFVSQTLKFGDVHVATTALLAEGGYSYIYSARELHATGGRSDVRTFALKKVLAQEPEMRMVAETERLLLQRFSGRRGFVNCIGTQWTAAPSVGPSARDYWFLLEYCPHGSLIDLIYCKTRDGEYEPRRALPQRRVLRVIEMVASAVAHMHSLQPPISHRDLKLENVLCNAAGEYVLCDFGSATSRILKPNRTRKQALAEEECIERYSTAMYRSPEMVDLYRNQEVSEKVDVWALGCISFALCFRAHPFAADSQLQILNASYCIPEDSPYTEDMHALIADMLTENPLRRPAASAVLQRVQALRAMPLGGASLAEGGGASSQLGCSVEAASGGALPASSRAGAAEHVIERVAAVSGGLPGESAAPALLRGADSEFRGARVAGVAAARAPPPPRCQRAAAAAETSAAAPVLKASSAARVIVLASGSTGRVNGYVKRPLPPLPADFDSARRHCTLEALQAEARRLRIFKAKVLPRR